MPQGLNLQLPVPSSVTEIMLNLFIGLLLSLIVAWHFTRYGRTLSNRHGFAWIFPIVTLTTVLVISIVKSSLTLSLGLVGALSIVRFRTPIKEPEELAYLFLAIAIGIGLGANQVAITIIAVVLILGFMAIRATASPRKNQSMFFLNLEIHNSAQSDKIFTRISDMLGKKNIKNDVRRVDSRDNMVTATYYVQCKDNEEMATLIEDLRRDIPNCAISFVRQDNLIGI